ncbi:MAG: hypothetical protein ACLFTT_04140 [Candidatus Hydrogenedentota bacterium]
MLRDLIEYSWPIAYEEAGPQDEPFIHVHFFGYFLTPAMVGKMFGWAVAHHFFYVWTVLGVVLLIAWFMRIVGSASIWFALLLLFFGGLDVLGHLLTAEPPWTSETGWVDYLTGAYWWSTSRGWFDYWSANFALSEAGAFMNGVFFRFFSPLSFLVDGPYHFLPTSVAVLMILHDLLRRRTTSRLLLLWGAVPYSSILVGTGLWPIVILGFLVNRFRRAITLQNAAGALLLLLALIYTLSNDGEIVTGWLWEQTVLSRALPVLLLYYVAEFGLLAVVCPRIDRTRLHVPRAWFYLCLAIFLAAPWYRLGEFNDFATKAIIPAQLTFLAWLGMALHQPEGGGWRRKVFVVLLCIGAIGPLGVVVRALEFGFDPATPPLERTRRVNEILHAADILGQSAGNPDAFFWKHLAKDVAYQPSEPIPVHRHWDFTDHADCADWDFYNRDWEPIDRGIRVYTETNNALMRLRNANLDARNIGTVRLEVELEDTQGAPIDGSVVLLWAGPEEAAGDPEDWVFDRWHSALVDPIQYSVSANPYWRGTIDELVFYVKDRGNHSRLCQVILKSLTLYTR